MTHRPPITLPFLALLALPALSACATEIELAPGDDGARTILPGDPPEQAPISPARVSAKWGHVCHIDLEGRLFCWGQNLAGELGVPGTGKFAPSPLPVDPAHRYREVSAGIGTTCAIRTDGALFCWGRNHGGPLCTGDTDAHDSPVQIGKDTDWEAVTMGSGMACGLRKGGLLYCWGGQDYGELLQPPLSPQALKEPTYVGAGFASLSSHWYRTMAVRADGAVWSSDNDGKFAPLQGFSGKAEHISVGVIYALVVDEQGALFHLDFDDEGKMITTAEVPSVAFAGAMATNYGGCSISAAGNIYCANDLTYEVPQLAALPAGDLRFTTVGVGNRFGCATAEDGSLRCWGTLHSDGDDPSVEYGDTPVPVP